MTNAFVLSDGGSLGAVPVGTLEALAVRGVELCAVAGVRS
jgi:hypothetical protein